MNGDEEDTEMREGSGVRRETQVRGGGENQRQWGGRDELQSRGKSKIQRIEDGERKR